MARDPRAMFFDEPLVRTASIPLGLWICAAVVAHLAGGGGAMEAAQLVHERDELRALVRSARQGMHPPDTTFEVLTEGTDPTPAEKVAPPEDAPKDSTDNPTDPDAPKADPEKAPRPEPEKPKPE